MQGLGFGAQGWRCRVWGLGRRAGDAGFGVWGAGLVMQGLGFGAQGW